nr:putative ribonuclease H-like domain-containing protein [Tanacetum cinerariifolium]
MLKQGDYEMWRLKIEQYFQVQDYPLWYVIENGKSFKPVAQTTTNDFCTLTTLISGLGTTEEKAQKKNDVKARSMLLMALPNEHLMTFNQYKDAKTLFAALQTRFGGESISQEDLNLKFLRSLPSKWNTHVVVWKNKPDLDTMSFDDLYNNFKIVEQEVKGTASSSLNSQNIAFVSSPSSTNEINTAYGVSIANSQANPASTQVNTASTQVSTTNLSDATVYAFLASQPNGSQLLHEDLVQIHEDDLEKMDLKCQLAFLSMRQPRNQESRNKNQDNSRRTINVEEAASNAMVATDGAGFDWSCMADDEVPTNMAFMAFLDSQSLDKLIWSQIVDNNKKGLGYKSYHAIPPPPTGLFLPPKLDLSNSGLKEFQQPEFEGYGPKTSKNVSEDISNEVKEFPYAPLIKNHPQKENQVYVDSGCSMHMTGNMSYLFDFKEFDGKYVTFGEEPKEEELLVKELLKLNSVLFTNTGCFVLSPDFKLTDESQVLLKFPRRNNMYSVDMKNIVPKESLTCLVTKATLDESMQWHRRLGHVNFKTINKLVKENLVRGLPTKRFENDQTCVACLKKKQHKASCKSKIQNSITQPLFMLHMDFFGPTFVSNLMQKKYGLVITDDYSRFTWVFFLATKDETTGIFKKFITEIENLVDKKVKVIRCDNRTEFKNSVMNDFCAIKGIKREFSIARTPQQNGFAERRNRTLIEAAKTMLADSKLPTTFWAEAVNTACYVQNKVLVVRPHNNTSYELFRGRTHALSFMRPFGCYVTILNTLDHLEKFDGKSDDGFFVGYSLNSTNSNDFVGTKESIGASHASQETGSSKDYILMPLWKDGSLFDSFSKNASYDEPQLSSDARNKNDEGVSEESEIDNQEKPENSTQDVNTARTSTLTSGYPWVDPSGSG